jgi:prophage maintenance system killer protein
MKTISLAVLLSFLVLSGFALAAQSGEQKDHSSMMQEMMKGGKQGEHKDGMMRMMKMMDQCAAMMESAQNSGPAKEDQK